MSDITSSIWHTKKEKPTEDKTIFAQHKSFRDGCIDCFLWEKQEFTEAIRKDVIAWTYLDNLLVCEQELIRTRKALEIAVKAMESAKYFRLDHCMCCGHDPQKDEVYIKLKKALEQITALEQKD